MKPKIIPAAKFKAECLALLDEVATGRGEIVVTKRGKPVARLVPLAHEQTARPKVKILGDIVNVGEPEWLK
ncbi:MAG: type II toxin-antitoxin system Phd/YefM family antitoxin [Archangium sp.]